MSTPDIRGPAATAAWNASQTFSTPCEFANFIVPAGVFIVNVFLWGAMGVTPYPSLTHGGAHVQGALYTTPGEVLRITVGGRGTTEECGFGGSGVNRHGGGFSAIARFNV